MRSSKNPRFRGGGEWIAPFVVYSGAGEEFALTGMRRHAYIQALYESAKEQKTVEKASTQGDSALLRVHRLRRDTVTRV